MFWNVLQIQIFFFFSNNYPVEIKLQQRTAKNALAAFFDVLFFCLRVCLHLRDFRIFGQPHNIIHRLSSFLMVGLNLTTKFLISEKIPFFLSFGTIFSDGGSSFQNFFLVDNCDSQKQNLKSLFPFSLSGPGSHRLYALYSIFFKIPICSFRGQYESYDEYLRVCDSFL